LYKENVFDTISVVLVHAIIVAMMTMEVCCREKATTATAAPRMEAADPVEFPITKWPIKAAEASRIPNPANECFKDGRNLA
jgi:hypothetical protein